MENRIEVRDEVTGYGRQSHGTEMRSQTAQSTTLPVACIHVTGLLCDVCPQPEKPAQFEFSPVRLWKHRSASSKSTTNRPRPCYERQLVKGDKQIKSWQIGRDFSQQVD
eukprot:TRINITY_DN36246_c0_g1_i1.p1 TRINITY_DN36246_c0_g1~~TRINITY_DN36246_c0_g1_i1.p1  ORF type:complete len:109 (+),score=4.87 TRINITY_DN36246_c0_g1_i1:103-429(+)